MKPDRDAPIGVFDSGVGGLTVAREIMRNLPSEKSYILEIQPEYPMEESPERILSGIPDRSFIFLWSSRSRQL